MSFFIMCYIAMVLGAAGTRYQAGSKSRAELKAARTMKDFVKNNPEHFLSKWVDDDDIETVIAGLEKRVLREYASTAGSVFIPLQLASAPFVMAWDFIQDWNLRQHPGINLDHRTIREEEGR